MNFYERILVGVLAVVIYDIAISGTAYEEFWNMVFVALATVGITESIILDRRFEKKFGKTAIEFIESEDNKD